MLLRFGSNDGMRWQGRIDVEEGYYAVCLCNVFETCLMDSQLDSVVGARIIVRYCVLSLRTTLFQLNTLSMHWNA